VRLLSSGSFTSARGPSLQYGIPAKFLLSAACICVTQVSCHSQSGGILCTGGSGQFTSTTTSKLTVTVGTQKDRGFSTRACEASLVWNKKKLTVVSDAWQVDLDAMNVDFGLGAPVVAFQFKKSDADSEMTYQVFSLHAPPVLLRTITGGEFFRAADTDMDGRIEIWAGDATAASGFENLPMANIDFPPTVVMRFEDRRLIDVSSEFRPFYDRRIAELHAQLDTAQMSDLKASNGKLDNLPPWQVEKLRALLSAKTKVLEIIWAYLYSGREQEAWQALADMWPAADLDRIRASIVKARAGGITTQVDGVARPGISLRKLDRIHVYDLTMANKTIDPIAAKMAGLSHPAEPQTDSSRSGDIVVPQPISISTPRPSDIEHVIPKSGLLLDLVIDDAGKVSSAQLLNEEDKGPIADSLIIASGHWKFIPAIKNGRAVASHIRLAVSPYQ
jgi:hypothetical protein